MEKPIQTISLAVIAVILTLGIGYCIGARCSWSRGYKNMDMKKGAMMMHGTMPGKDSMKGMTSMEDMMHEMTMGLHGKTGADFDKAFIDEMIIHHEGAVDMAKLVLEQSERKELKDLANDIITAQTKEIDMMKQWKAEWFK